MNASDVIVFFLVSAALLGLLVMSTMWNLHVHAPTLVVYEHRVVEVVHTCQSEDYTTLRNRVEDCWEALGRSTVDHDILSSELEKCYDESVRGESDQ